MRPWHPKGLALSLLGLEVSYVVISYFEAQMVDNLKQLPVTVHQAPSTYLHSWLRLYSSWPWLKAYKLNDLTYSPFGLPTINFDSGIDA
jgi:hypothetical protein